MAAKPLPPFTPVIHAVAQVVGNGAANVFGEVLRHTMMGSGLCYAAVGSMAEALKLTEKTVRVHLKKLVAGGYLNDNTPGLRYHPHNYSLGAKYYETIGSVKTGREILPLGRENFPLGREILPFRIVNFTDNKKNIRRIKEEEERENTTTTSLLEVIMAYNDLKIRMTDYYFNTWLKDNADNALTWGSTIEEFATAVDVMMKKIVMRLKLGEVLGDDVLFDSDIFEESLYEVKMIGSEAILTELFQAEVIVR